MIAMVPDLPDDLWELILKKVGEPFVAYRLNRRFRRLVLAAVRTAECRASDDIPHDLPRLRKLRLTSWSESARVPASVDSLVIANDVYTLVALPPDLASRASFVYLGGSWFVPLPSMSSLTRLECCVRSQRHFDAVCDAVNLDKLIVRCDHRAADLDRLRRLRRLTELRFFADSVSGIEPVLSLTRLTRLDLLPRLQTPPDLSGVTRLGALKTLALSIDLEAEAVRAVAAALMGLEVLATYGSCFFEEDAGIDKFQGRPMAKTFFCPFWPNMTPSLIFVSNTSDVAFPEVITPWTLP